MSALHFWLYFVILLLLLLLLILTLPLVSAWWQINLLINITPPYITVENERCILCTIRTSSQQNLLRRLFDLWQ